MVGYDKYDVASVEHLKEDYVAALNQPVNAMRLGIPRARHSSTFLTRKRGKQQKKLSPSWES
jgi:hypothetical protein